MGIGARIAGQCHVGDSNFQVIRTIYRRMDKEGRRNPAHRELRKCIYREALKAHEANRELYFTLALGGFD